ncbi:MAG: translocation/assembly module TamB domain-containing protein [Steroidobacteraceae bacterium]|nr:translocation/assembly module TamB domain-containing protein [Steroidobacteraceae bacterium]
MLLRLSRVALIVFAALLGLAGGTTYLLAFTQSGLQFVVRRLPERIGPVTLRIGAIRGTLARGVACDRLDIEHPRTTLRIEGGFLRLELWPLLWQTIDAQELVVQKAHITVRRRDVPPARNPRFLPPFLTIRSDAVRVREATLIAANGRQFDLADIAASGFVRYKTIRLRDVRGRWQQVALRGDVEFTAGNPLRLTGRSQWQFSPAGQPGWNGQTRFAGDLARLAIEADVAAPLRARFDGSARDLNRATWSWEGRGRIDHLDLTVWGAGGALGGISGQLDLRGDRSGFEAQGPLQSAGLDVGDIDARIAGHYQDRVIRTRLIQFVHRRSGATVEARGDIGIVAGGPRLELSGTWRQFRWPLVGSAAVSSAAGRFSLQGLWPYALRADGSIQLPGFEAVQASIDGRLATDRLVVERGSATILGGNGAFAGEARWSPDETWQIKGKMQALQTARLRTGLDGRINFDFAAAGDGFDGSALTASFANLSGRIRGAPARGGGSVALNAGRWRFQDFRLAAGGLQLAIDGGITPQARDLRFTVVASDLAVLAPQSRGRLRAAGTVRGTANEVLLDLQASGSDLQHAGVSVGALRANVQLDPRAGRRSDVDVEVQRIAVRGREVRRAQLRLAGSAEASDLSLEASLGASVWRATAAGRFVDGVWRGEWRTMTIDDDARLHLKLESPAAVSAGLNGAVAERFCLRGAAARLCQSARWEPPEWRLAASAENLPLDALTAGASTRVFFDGTVDGQLQLSARGDAPLVGELRGQLRDARVRRVRPRNRVDVVALGSGSVSLLLDPDNVRGQLKLDAGQAGFIDGALAAERRGAGGAALAPLDWPLRASLRAESGALSLANLFVPQIDRAAGSLTVDLAFNGTLGAPAASGALTLTGGELDLYQVNFALRELQASATLQRNRLDFESSGRAGDGRLQARGALQWVQGQIRGTLTLQGQNLLAVNVPEARVTASPDLRFELLGRQAQVTGEVKLPFARFAPADLAGAVLPTADEVIAGTPTPSPDERTRFTANIRMSLGDDVEIDTFGLSGRLTGSIQTRTDDDGTTRATGELQITSGKYAALGRRLDIERGRLLFTGGLIGDPAVDIRATKRYPEVMAGVNVRGTLQAPRMTFFSEPALPQSQIVSLILAGGAFDTAQDPTRQGAARNELLAQGGAILAQQIGSRIGVDDVGLEQGLDNQTALVLGKYLSPRLYVSYGISLAESINTIKMRYALDDRWTIRTEAGKERSAELVYTFEK